MRPVRAEAVDWPAIRDLLTASGLPLDGAREAFDTGVVIRESNRIVGCAAVEPHGSAAILTETAESWFSRLGFVLIDRTAVPPEVAASVEFQTACSASAVAMRRPLA